MSERELRPGDVWGDPSDPATWQYLNAYRNFKMFGTAIARKAVDRRSGINITAALAKAQADAAALQRVRALWDRWQELAKVPSPIRQSICDELQQAIEGGV